MPDSDSHIGEKKKELTADRRGWTQMHADKFVPLFIGVYRRLSAVNYSYPKRIALYLSQIYFELISKK